MANLINSYTQLYGIIGNPVRHSMSPILHNALFRKYNLNKVYLAFEVNKASDAIKALKILDIKGLSVTIPFKQDIMKYLDSFDSLTKKVKAVNTVVNKKGKLYGYNTDITGAIEALKEETELKDKKVLILGAGGVARAIAFGLVQHKTHIIITNRTESKGKKLAKELNIKFKKKNEIDFDKLDIIINCTSVGMMPEIDNSPLNISCIPYRKIVFDTVYNPIETKLIKYAKQKKCKIITGIEMFVNQAAEQFFLWTGIRPDRKVLKNIVLKSLKK